MVTSSTVEGRMGQKSKPTGLFIARDFTTSTHHESNRTEVSLVAPGRRSARVSDDRPEPASQRERSQRERSQRRERSRGRHPRDRDREGSQREHGRDRHHRERDRRRDDHREREQRSQRPERSRSPHPRKEAEQPAATIRSRERRSPAAEASEAKTRSLPPLKDVPRARPRSPVSTVDLQALVDAKNEEEGDIVRGGPRVKRERVELTQATPVAKFSSSSANGERDRRRAYQRNCSDIR